MKKKIIIAVTVVFIAVFAVLVYVSNSKTDAEIRELNEKIESSMKQKNLMRPGNLKIQKQPDKEKLRKMMRRQKTEKEKNQTPETEK
jgi:regulatory protein YycI of two-component signal transduction system YycFG